MCYCLYADGEGGEENCGDSVGHYSELGVSDQDAARVRESFSNYVATLEEAIASLQEAQSGQHHDQRRKAPAFLPGDVANLPCWVPAG